MNDTNEILKLTNLFMQLIDFKSKVNPKYSNNKRLDLGLCYLFESFRNHKDLISHVSMKYEPYEFHKAFRQYDIVTGFDSVFWQLLSGSDLFFKAYELYCSNKEFDEFLDDMDI